MLQINQVEARKKNINQKKWKRLGNAKEQITDKENTFGGNLEGKKRAIYGASKMEINAEFEVLKKRMTIINYGE